MGRDPDDVVITPPMKKLALAALATATLVPLAASASHVDVRDANDVKGRFDVRLVQMGNDVPRKWRVKMWSKWTAKQVWDSGFVLVYLDTFGSERADYYALLRSNGKRMVATLHRDRQTKSDYRMKNLKVSRPSGAVVTVTVPFGDLQRRASGLYRWRVQSLWSGPKCRRICFDRAPNDQDVTEPGPRPTATIPPPPPTPAS